MLLALLFLIFILCLHGAKFTLQSFNNDYLSKDSTNSIKGIFILLIVISHSLSYIRDCGYLFNGIGDFWFMKFFNMLSQLVVVMFLFYSGYGVGESIKSKGLAYIKAMPRHRILGTLLNFDIAVLAFIVLDLLLGISLTPKQCLLSLTGWASVGNSNWYIFVILLCYLMTYITMRLPLKRTSHMVILLFGMCMVCILLLSMFKEYYWYNTLLCYPVGLMYSAFKDRFESRFRVCYWMCALTVTVTFMLVYICLKNHSQIAYNAISIVFAFMMVVLTMKMSIKNNILKWLGKHLFPVYIYMRLPMILMANKTPEVVGAYPVLFIIISLMITLTIANLYKHWEIRL